MVLLLAWQLVHWLNVNVVDAFTIFTTINSLPLKISYKKKGVVARSVG